MQKDTVVLSGYQFKRAIDGLIQVINENSYVMAEYSPRTGNLRWQRVVPAPQKEKLQARLLERYPVEVAPRG